MDSLILPHVIAHRGAPHYAPENTILSLRKAQKLGATWVEFDVMLTQDGVPVVIHDETVDRTTNGYGFVSQYHYAELSRLDAGGGQSIPTLEEWLTVAAELGMGINIELKEKTIGAQAIAAKTHALLQKKWTKSLPKPLISSSNMACLTAYRQLDHKAQIALISGFMPVLWRAKLASVKACALVIDHQHVSAKKVQELHEVGYKVLAYTVNNQKLFEKMLIDGVDSVFTDDLKTVREPSAVKRY